MGVPKDNVAAVDEKVEARVDDDEKMVDGDHVARPIRKVYKGGVRSECLSMHFVS